MAREFVIGPERAPAVTTGIENLDQSARCPLVVGSELRRDSAPCGRRVPIASPLRLIPQCGSGSGGFGAVSRPGALEPLLELGRLVGERERREEIATVDGHRIDEASVAGAVVEFGRVAPQNAAVDRDLVGRPGDEHVLGRLPTQVIERLPKCLARRFDVRVRPEQRQQGLAAHEAL